MIELEYLIFMFILHFFGDFVLQSDEMAQNKSTSWKWLSTHIAVYTLTLCILSPKWALINGFAHFLIDAITSRASKILYQRGDIHNFFVVIGIDQTLHYIILVVSWCFLYGL